MKCRVLNSQPAGSFALRMKPTAWTLQSELWIGESVCTEDVAYVSDALGLNPAATSCPLCLGIPFGLDF